MTQEQTIDLVLNEELADELEQRAASLYLPAGRYIELVLLEELTNGYPEAGG